MSALYSFDIGLVTDKTKLRKVSYAPIKDVDSIYLAIQEMGRICEENDGAGISAIQVGIPWKISLVAVGADLYRAFVNCDYKPDKKKGQRYYVEGCLSLPGEQLWRVKRWNKVLVNGWEFYIDQETQEPKTKKVYELFYATSENPTGCIVQHELDHQRGVLISDHGTVHAPPKKKTYIDDLLSKKERIEELRREM